METDASAAIGGGPPAGIARGALTRSSAGVLNPARVWSAALLGAVIASLVAGLAGELTHGVFQPEMELVSNPFGQLAPQPTARTVNAAELKNAIVAHAVLGCVIGLAFGLGGGLASGKLFRAVIVALGAQALGALIGALAAWALVRLLYRSLTPDMNDLATPILIHAAIWAAIGTVGGIAFSLSAGLPRLAFRAAGAACVAGFLASAIYQLFGAILFPESGATEMVATSRNIRLLGASLFALLIAGATALATARGASESTASLPA
jgi:hypothetical protein